jgi:hypothetical protein
VNYKQFSNFQKKFYSVPNLKLDPGVWDGQMLVGDIKSLPRLSPRTRSRPRLRLRLRLRPRLRPKL